MPAADALQLPLALRTPGRRSRPYYATTPISALQLEGAMQVAEAQDELVLAIFRHARRAMGPSEVWRIGCSFGRTWLLTSVRRSITNLTEDGVLQKTDVVRDGLYGKSEHCWELWAARQR